MDLNDSVREGRRASVRRSNRRSKNEVLNRSLQGTSAEQSESEVRTRSLSRNAFNLAGNGFGRFKPSRHFGSAYGKSVGSDDDQSRFEVIGTDPRRVASRVSAICPARWHCRFANASAVDPGRGGRRVELKAAALCPRSSQQYFFRRQFFQGRLTWRLTGSGGLKDPWGNIAKNPSSATSTAPVAASAWRGCDARPSESLTAQNLPTGGPF